MYKYIFGGNKLISKLLQILILLFIINIIGYIYIVLKEKFYLKNNIIVIDKKSVTQAHIKEADMKEFILNGAKVKAGDEVKILLRGKKKVEGIIIGVKRKEREILIVTHDDEVKKFNVDNISRFRIVSKYGKFFKTF